MRYAGKAIGFLCGAAVILGVFGLDRTARFGAAQAKTTWTLVYSNVNQDNNIIHATTVDGVSGWAVGVESNTGNSSPVGLRTTDGVSWSPMSLPQGSGGPMDLTMFTAVAFSDNQNGWLLGVTFSLQGEQPHLWATSNAGGSWTEVFLPAETPVHLQALPSGHYYAVGGQTFVWSSDGQNCVESNPPVPQEHTLKGVFMLNAECGYLVAATDPEAGPGLSAVLWTGDGGQNWEVRAQDLGYILRRLWFVNADLGWAAGRQADGDGVGIVAVTSDGGRTWTPITLPDHPPPMGQQTVPVTNCEDVRFFDDVRGVALCLACTGDCETDSPSFVTAFARSGDGGLTWEMDPDYEPVMTAPPFGDMVKYSAMWSMAFADPNTGIMAGQNNLILRYVADDPEQPGWSDPDCSSSNGNTNNNANGNQNNGAGSDDAALSGCGCRVGFRTDRDPRMTLLLLVLAVLGASGVLRLRVRGARRRNPRA